MRCIKNQFPNGCGNWTTCKIQAHIIEFMYINVPIQIQECVASEHILYTTENLSSTLNETEYYGSIVSMLCISTMSMFTRIVFSLDILFTIRILRWHHAKQKLLQYKRIFFTCWFLSFLEYFDEMNPPWIIRLHYI